MIDALSGPQAGKNFRLLIQAIRRNQHGDMLADRFLGTLAEQTFRALIPADDRVVRRIDNGAEQEGRMLAFHFRSFSGCDLHEQG
jgi:hypothetical protein